MRVALRSRALGVVVAVVIAPLVLVLAAGGLETRRESALLAAVEAAAGEAAAALDAGGEATAADGAARRARVRVAVVDRPRRLTTLADHNQEDSLRDRIGDAMLGPGGPPTLAAHDAARGLIEEAPEVRAASQQGASRGCMRAVGGALSVCHAAVRLADGRVVLAEKSSPRVISLLADAPFALLKLTSYTLVVGLFLAAFLGRRIVRPVERLAERARQRRAGAEVDRTPVSADEIGDLGLAFDELADALVAKGRANEAFAADLAHELKSPIAAVGAVAHQLRERSEPLDPARAARLGQMLGDSAARLDALTTRFLDLARAEAGLRTEPRAAADLAALVRGITARLDEGERFPGVAFAVDAPSPVAAPIALGPLESALQNVLENAGSFARSQVTVRVQAEGQEALLVVEDDGPGIPPEHLTRVFDRFFTERKEGGTGLGLAYTKAVLEAHGGSIHASQGAVGACFSLRLPLAPARG